MSLSFCSLSGFTLANWRKQINVRFFSVDKVMTADPVFKYLDI